MFHLYGCRIYSKAEMADIRQIPEESETPCSLYQVGL